MEDAPTDERLLLLVPTDDDEQPIEIELGWWDEENEQWDGEWRHMEGEGSFAGNDPVAWAPTPEVDEETIKVLVEAGVLELDDEEVAA